MTGGPQVGVGAIVVRDGKVLLVQRGLPPTEGEWAIPGGRQRLGETLQQGAEREVFEETGIRIRASEPVYTCEYLEHGADGAVRFHYVIVDLAADYLDGTLRAGDDARMARWVGWSDLPSLALNASSRTALKRLFPGETTDL